MINNEYFLSCLKKNKIDFFTGVPDSLLKDFISYLDENIISPFHLPASNEGNAIGLAIGSYLATGNLPLIYLQNSGLGNVINPILSLADNNVYGIPMILLIGWRGKPGTKDEPQHFKQGLVTTEILDAIQIPHKIINSETSNDEVALLIKNGCKKSLELQQPFAFLIEEDTFETYNSKKNNKNSHLLSREHALEITLDLIGKNSIVVSTTGKLSRELYEIREKNNFGHANDFLTVGGMGHANQIATGIAIRKPEKNVVCLDGDGSLLMHMGTLALNGSLNLKNYKHILFNNEVHDSVGGQCTSAPSINFHEIAKCCGYLFSQKVKTIEDLKKNLSIINKNQSSSFIEIKIGVGARSNLSRPKISPKENKLSFVKKINE